MGRGVITSKRQEQVTPNCAGGMPNVFARFDCIVEIDSKGPAQILLTTAMALYISHLTSCAALPRLFSSYTLASIPAFSFLATFTSLHSFTVFSSFRRLEIPPSPCTYLRPLLHSTSPPDRPLPPTCPSRSRTIS